MPGLKPFLVVPVDLAGALPSAEILRLLEPIAPHFMIESDVAEAYQQRGISIIQLDDIKAKRSRTDHTFFGKGQSLDAFSMASLALLRSPSVPVLLASRSAAASLLDRYPSAAPALTAGEGQAVIAVRPLPPTQFTAKRISDAAGRPDLPLARRLLDLVKPI